MIILKIKVVLKKIAHSIIDISGGFVRSMRHYCQHHGKYGTENFKYYIMEELILKDKKFKTMLRFLKYKEILKQRGWKVVKYTYYVPNSFGVDWYEKGVTLYLERI